VLVGLDGNSLFHPTCTHNFALLFWEGLDLIPVRHWTLLEITSSLNTSLVSKSFIRHKARQKSQLSPNTFFSTLNYISFLMVNVFYVHTINLSLKPSYINLFGCWLLSRSFSRHEFPFLSRSYESLTPSPHLSRKEKMSIKLVKPLYSKTKTRIALSIIWNKANIT